MMELDGEKEFVWVAFICFGSMCDLVESNLQKHLDWADGLVLCFEFDILSSLNNLVQLSSLICQWRQEFV